MNLYRTLVTVSGMTMLSRITGLIREILFARTFGASALTDAFNIAFRIPNLLRRLFAEGAFSQAFVPILAEYRSNKTQPEVRELIDHVATVMAWVMLLTCLTGILAAPAVVLVIATGLTDNSATFDASVTMTRIMFPYIGFMSFVALSGGILNTYREFRIPAFTPILLNLSFIIAALFVAPHLAQPVYAMAFAVFAGGLLQAAIQIPALIRIGMWPRLYFNPLFSLRSAGVRRILAKMGPAIFAVSAAQISLMINTNIASRLTDGSVSWLSYADRLMEFPTALLGVALGTILLPSLSSAHAEGNTQEYSSLLDWGLRLTCLLALPCAVGLATLSIPLTATLFHYGKFDALSVHMTSHALVAYGIGLIGLIMVKILAPGFYAKQDIRTPVRIAIGVLVLTQVMNLFFVPWFAHAGLALSIGLAACLNALLLYTGLRRRGIYTPLPGWPWFLARLLIALVLLGLTTWTAAGLADWVSLRAHPWTRVAYLSAIMMLAGMVYFAALFALGFRLRDFRRK